jgi:hypothetical protein
MNLGQRANYMLYYAQIGTVEINDANQSIIPWEEGL